MSVIDRLASALGERGEGPNVELAKEIAATGNKQAIKELVANLRNKSKDIQSDCIKVLYEAGERNPGLIAGYAADFVSLLDHKNNRMVWGAMTALDAIAVKAPAIIYPVLGKLTSIADKGSVITRDHLVGILTKLISVKQYADDAFVLLIEQLQSCPTNQLPMYAENAEPVIGPAHKATFIKVLTARLPEVDKDPKRKRIEKVIKKMA